MAPAARQASGFDTVLAIAAAVVGLGAAGTVYYIYSLFAQ
jgi:hypothetical protein